MNSNLETQIDVTITDNKLIKVILDTKDITTNVKSVIFEPIISSYNIDQIRIEITLVTIKLKTNKTLKLKCRNIKATVNNLTNTITAK